MSIQTVSLDQRYDLFDRQDAIGGNTWPEFMLHDPVPLACWGELIKAFKKFQLMILDHNEILVVINSVPLQFNQDINQLPDRGVDWGVQKSLSDFKAGHQPNFLMAVQVVVNNNHQGMGLSMVSVQEICKLALEQGIQRVIVPLRPSNKHEFPLISMGDYINWKNENDLPFDSWLRVHTKMGAQLIKICPESMHIPGTVAEWVTWTGLRFPGTGSYIIPGALNPVTIDLENNVGEYYEPNIWLLHDLTT